MSGYSGKKYEQVRVWFEVDFKFGLVRLLSLYLDLFGSFRGFRFGKSVAGLSLRLWPATT